jgi:hypothetical protein
MPDPIRSATPSPIPTYQDAECVDPLLGGRSSVTSQPGAESAQGPGEAAVPSRGRTTAQRDEPRELPPAVKSLVARNGRPNSAAEFVQNRQQNANTIAERIAQSPVRLLKHDTGITADGSRYETAGLLYGHDPATGMSGELGVISAQEGAQNELQITGMRSSVQSQGGDSLSVEGFTVQEGWGIHNKDGSTGHNASVGATLVGTEGTVNAGGNSITLGASIGATLEASVGTRDSDHDGKTEYCFRVAIPGAPSIGACVEVPDNPPR